MKTLGLLGGMTYHSTILYYSQINAHIQRRLGGPHAASLILHSFNFAEMSALMGAGDWPAVAARFVAAAQHMKAAGATGLAIGCNIGHRVARELEAGAGLPVLHIADFAAAVVRARGLRKVALLATRAAMEGEFITGRFGGVEVLVPGEADRGTMDRAIFEELSTGTVTEEARGFVRRVVEELVRKGAEGVVLACTDLQFVLTPEEVSVPLFDTLELHAKGLADWALEDET